MSYVKTGCGEASKANIGKLGFLLTRSKLWGIEIRKLDKKIISITYLKLEHINITFLGQFNKPAALSAPYPHATQRHIVARLRGIFYS